ncbi:FAD-binding oxidoreductase [Rhodovibrionaceae bacterium A322]
MSPVESSLLTPLAEIFGADQIRQQADLAGMDPGLNVGNFGAGLQVRVRDVSQLQALVKLANEAEVSLVPQGGLTSLAGAAVSKQGQVQVDLRGFSGIESLDPLNAVAVVKAGTPLAELEAAANKEGLTFGVDLGARDTATLGGMVSTNAGGIEAFRFGMIRQRVLGMEAVLPDGSLLSDLSLVTKCNEGYDIKQLLIGAEGTLGIITRLALRLSPVVPARATCFLALESAQKAVKAYHQLNRSQGGQLLAAEIMFRNFAHTSSEELGLRRVTAFEDAPVYAIFEWGAATEEAASHRLEELLGELFEADLLLNGLLAKSGNEREEIWRIREDSWSIDRVYPQGLWYDVSVPLDRLDEYVIGLQDSLTALDPGLMLFAMGHLGDGNLHLTISGEKSSQALKEPVTDLVNGNLKIWGGSISAEHGIGLEKKPALSALGDPAKLAAMSAVKAALDPKGIMNPGKIF